MPWGFFNYYSLLPTSPSRQTQEWLPFASCQSEISETLSRVNSHRSVKMTTLDTLSSIMMLSFNILGLICSLTFITIAIFHRQCHTTTILLVLNSVIAGLLSNIICGSQAIYQLVSDGNDHLCVLRGYLLYSSTGLLYHTLCVQAVHRLFVIVLGTRRYLQTKKVIAMIVFAQWTVSGCFVLPIFLSGRIRYNSGSRICLVSAGVQWLVPSSSWLKRSAAVRELVTARHLKLCVSPALRLPSMMHSPFFTSVHACTFSQCSSSSSSTSWYCAIWKWTHSSPPIASDEWNDDDNVGKFASTFGSSCWLSFCSWWGFPIVSSLPSQWSKEPPHRLPMRIESAIYRSPSDTGWVCCSVYCTQMMFDAWSIPSRRENVEPFDTVDKFNALLHWRFDLIEPLWNWRPKTSCHPLKGLLSKCCPLLLC